jgi:hypothetical protein
MSTAVSELLAATRALPPEQKTELVSALNSEILQPGRKQLVSAVRGKYADVPTCTEDFPARKSDDLILED